MDLKLIKNEPKYYELIRVLRTHPENTEGFLEQVNITSQQQIDYMSKYESNYFICLNNNEPVGFVGEIDGDIRFAVNPDMKNMGIGKFMINELIKLNKEVHAKVLLDNISSQRVFESCGFKLSKIDDKFKHYTL